jgi:hypothetical protein
MPALVRPLRQGLGPEIQAMLSSPEEHSCTFERSGEDIRVNAIRAQQ